MAEDWDLYAVVRSCAATRANRSTCAARTKREPESNDFACLASMISDDSDDDPFGFPDLVRPKNNAYEELNHLCMPFFPIGFDSHAPPRKRRRVAETVSSGDVFEAKHRTGCVQSDRGILEAANGTMLPAPALLQPQNSPRLRKRKGHQKKVVCEVTAENLSSDMWAWRKYGQKPIKGSPYPRNYYRCSSSKGCSARKQVEKSTTDPNIFVVTYTGDHIHPRPTHRNSLAGSTRNKLSGAAKPTNQESYHDQPNNNNNTDPSCSSAASLSPKTSLSSPVVRGGQSRRDDLDDHDMLILNRVISEDIFMGLQELGYGSGFLTPKLEPSWAAVDSSSATAGGGC